MKLNCVVLGACGFLGSHLIESLLKLGATVVAIDMLAPSEVTARRWSALATQSGATLSVAKLDLRAVIQTDLAKVDVVFHLASSTLPAASNENPEIGRASCRERVLMPV